MGHFDWAILVTGKKKQYRLSHFPSAFPSLVDFAGLLHSSILVWSYPRDKKNPVEGIGQENQDTGQRRYSPWESWGGKAKSQISKPRTKAWRLRLPHEETPERGMEHNLLPSYFGTRGALGMRSVEVLLSTDMNVLLLGSSKEKLETC